ncbi:hypothetical protein E3N88_41237 [Mikania micrantha]|uniref:Reverse transcriptase Ty1/copia-type domain-containing protein n=1 Tax=Mikania micrantha TaxID=192012 RepID=A0A5N6LPU9_9ASTR|nr:hypothetical protein E3N88_41237 [Mikania micrantha]
MCSESQAPSSKLTPHVDGTSVAPSLTITTDGKLAPNPVIVTNTQNKPINPTQSKPTDPIQTSQTTPCTICATDLLPNTNNLDQLTTNPSAQSPTIQPQPIPPAAQTFVEPITITPPSSTQIPSAESTSSIPPPPPPPTTHPMQTRAKSGIFKTKHKSNLAFHESCSLIQTLFAKMDPKSFKMASSEPVWIDAMQREMDALHKNKTWTLVPRPLDHNVVGCKWLYRTKFNADGSIERHKARLVAQGFSQIPGMDFSHTFSPV